MSETPAPARGAHLRRGGARAARRAGPRPSSTRRWTGSRPSPSCSASPQKAYPVVHLTGTNGKTSTSRMIDTLIRATGLRTGRFTSPHVESMTERISLDGDPLTEEQFLEAYNDVAALRRGSPTEDSRAPAVVLRDRRRDGLRGVRRRPGRRRRSSRSAWAASWDATNVADATVAVITPIAVDHAQYLGATAGRHRRREGRHHQARRDRGDAPQQDRRRGGRDAAERAAEVGATVLWEGLDFGVLPAGAGGRRPDAAGCSGLRGEYDEVFLPLYGAHQGQQRRARAGGGRGVRRRRAARRRPGPRGVRARSPRPAASRWSAAARRSCSTPPTTRTAPPRSWTRSRTPSRSAR